MSKKTAIQTHINTDLASASQIPASRHRNVLSTDEDSILENIYGYPVRDISSGTKTVTANNANFYYYVEFSKVGRNININGSFQNISGGTINFGNGNIFSFIPDTEFFPFDYTFSTANNSNSDFIRIVITENGLTALGTVLVTESFNFNFTYKSLE